MHMSICTIAISSFVRKLKEHENSNVSSNNTLNLPEVAVQVRSLWHFLWAMKRKLNWFRLISIWKATSPQALSSRRMEHRSAGNFQCSQSISHCVGIAEPREHWDLGPVPSPAPGALIPAPTTLQGSWCSTRGKQWSHRLHTPLKPWKRRANQRSQLTEHFNYYSWKFTSKYSIRS